jgi:hypothetical protein
VVSPQHDESRSATLNFSQGMLTRRRHILGKNFWMRFAVSTSPV